MTLLSNDSYKREAALYHRPGFFGVRAISYMLLSLIIGMAIPITIAGNLEVINRTIAPSWARIYWVLSAVVASLMVFHIFILPKV